MNIPKDSALVVVNSGPEVGSVVLDSGSGIILAQSSDPMEPSSYVLTCAHNLRAARRVPYDNNPSRIVVNGVEASEIEDPSLHKLDLAVLEVKALLADPARIRIGHSTNEPVQCNGFVSFFQHQFERRTVQGMIEKDISTVTPDGDSVVYMEISSISGGRRQTLG